MTQLGLLISNGDADFTRTDKFAFGAPAYGCGYAAYVLGQNAWTGTEYTPATDLSKNDRDLIVTGTIGAQALAGPTNYADTPFTGADLCTRTGRCTIVVVCETAPGISAFPLSNRIAGTSGVNWIGIYQTNNSFSASAQQRIDGDERRSDDSENASTRSGFEFLAGTFGANQGAKLYRSQDGVGLRIRPADTTPPLATVGGPLPFRLGRSHTLGTDGATNVAMALFFDDILSPSQVEELLTYVTAFLSANTGIVVAGGTPALENSGGTSAQVQVNGAAILGPLVARAEAAAALADSDGNATRAENAADLSQAWAEGTEPGGVGTFSSKEWAEQSAASALVFTSVFETTGYYEDTARITIDSVGKVFAYLKVDGTEYGRAPIIGGAAIETDFDPVTGLTTIDLAPDSGIVSRIFAADYWEGSDSVTLDANGNVVAFVVLEDQQEEITATSLIDDDGFPRAHLINPRFIREFPRIRDQLIYDAATLTMHVAFVGDSYTELGIWLRNLSRAWKAELGNGGPGWCGVGYPAGSPGNINGNVDETELAVVPYGTANIVGTWMAAEHSPDCCSATSSTAGSGFTFTYAGANNLTSVEAFFLGGSGVSRYRWNSGAWTTLNLSGSGGQKVALSGVPAATNWTLDWEVVSGTCVFHGINCLTGLKGIVVHDLAVSGSSLVNHWAASIRTNPTTWRVNEAAAMKRLGDIRTFVVPLGTNDQTYNLSYDAYELSMELWIDEVGRVTTPGADILWVCAPENGRDPGSFPLRMAEFAKRAKSVSLAKNVALIDMQPLFGASYAEYGNTGTQRVLIGPDLLHPTNAGGAVYRQAINTALTFRS